MAVQSWSSVALRDQCSFASLVVQFQPAKVVADYTTEVTLHCSAWEVAGQVQRPLEAGSSLMLLASLEVHRQKNVSAVAAKAEALGIAAVVREQRVGRCDLHLQAAVPFHYQEVHCIHFGIRLEAVAAPCQSLAEAAGTTCFRGYYDNIYTGERFECRPLSLRVKGRRFMNDTVHLPPGVS
eukprot:m.856062 g.856062  ORF g.856062 m.856062 type:complete len:181 (-) comp23511_c0_seq1:46-588(-)